MNISEPISSLYGIFEFCTQLFYQIYATSQDVIFFLSQPIKIFDNVGLAGWFLEWILSVFGVELQSFSYLQLMFGVGLIIILVWAFVNFILPT